MNKARFFPLILSAILKHRHFWFGILLLIWVAFTAIVLIIDWKEATRWVIFRRGVQMIIFSVWGIERLRKYRAEKAAVSTIR